MTEHAPGHRRHLTIRDGKIQAAIDEATNQTAKRLAAEGFTTVDYDRRGRGGSGDTQPWALDREVEDVAAPFS
jgi:predicted acyl esterase